MKDNFDDIVKRKWEHMQFPVDENHRSDMIQLLDQQKRRRGVFFWWLGGLLIAVVAGSMFLLSPNQDGDPGENAVNATGKPELHAPVSSTTSQHQTATDELKANQQNDNTSTTHSKTITSGEGNLNTKQVASNSLNKPLSKPATNDGKQTKADDYPVKGKRQEESIKSGEQKIIKNTSPVQETKPDITMLVPLENIVPATSNLADDHSIVDPNENNTNKVVVEETINPVSNIQVRDISLLTPIQTLPLSSIDIDQKSLTPGIGPGFTKEHPFAFFAEAGVGYVPPSFPDIKSGWSMELGGGVNYSLMKSTNIFFSAGYYLQKGGFDFQRTSTADQPGFGARSISNSLTPDKLHFIYSKFGVEQKFRRHAVTGALGFHWLYGAQGTIDIRTQDQFNPQAVDETKYAWLVLDGMNRLLWSGELEYGYQLSPRFKLSLGLKHYFSHITKDDAALKDEGYYWSGKLAPFNPSFTIQYRIYGK